MNSIKFTRFVKFHGFSFIRSCSYFSISKSMHQNTFLKNHYFKALIKSKFFEKNFSILSCLRSNENNLSNEEKEIIFDETFAEAFTNRLYIHPNTFHNVLVIQPRNKSKEKYEKIPDCERKMDEAVALINTLRQWKVVEKHVFPTSCIISKFMFGSGNLKKIKAIVQKNVNVSGIFIGVDIMTALQNCTLEEYFGLPVFDRYQIILQIFHDHAHTKEAKLQLALAEIPYLRVKLAGFGYTWNSSNFSGIHKVGGEGETFMEKRRRLILDREMKIKKALEKVRSHRELLRSTERRSKLPVVAVVGYTNCGKTTLIKALTNDERLLPEDKLFATLDVTVHGGRLPSSQKVLFIDTVGFILNVPTHLIQAFKSTLEEITLADLVIHVRDISHPDAENQKLTVLKTLEELDLPEKLINTILEVRNKADLLENIPQIPDDPEALYISATEGTNLPHLLEITQEKLLENTDHSVSLLRVQNGGEEYRWLLKEGAIRDTIVDNQDQNYLIVEVILSSASLGKFKHKFGDLTISLEEIRNSQ